jgi:two-component system NtrC family sensor kinase
MKAGDIQPRVLIIDDEEVVRDSIREILSPKEKVDQHLIVAAGNLFGDWEPMQEAPPARRYHPAFRVDEANNGKTGLEQVIRACEEQDPYAIIYCDMRMPGWDGLQTCAEIRKVDPKVQVFFVTAYSDHSLEEILAVAGADVGYLSKPFIPEEILQIATKAAYDWQRLSNLEHLLQVVSQIGVGESHLSTLLSNLLHQISTYLRTDHAILGEIDSDHSFREISRIGVGDLPVDIAAITQELSSAPYRQLELVNGILICRMEAYCVLAVHPAGEEFNQEKTYLLQLFLQNAIRSIQNATLSQQLVQQEKLSAIGQAMSMILHDIKTPVSQIQSLAELIQMEIEEAPETLEMTEMIVDASTHAMDIISDMRDFVQNAALEKEVIPLAPFFRGIEKEMGPLLSEVQVDLAVEVPEDLRILGDPRKLRRVFVNLINNASEALQGTATSPARISLRASRQGDQLVVRVADNGPGIPPPIQEKLFEAFVTSGKSTGTGLGLAIAKQVVEVHGGSISVASSSAGATFTMNFPLSE